MFTMRGKYRQTFLRVSADREETTQSANLKVETNKTLLVVMEGVRVSYWYSYYDHARPTHIHVSL
jgi:hypothetical protein